MVIVLIEEEIDMRKTIIFILVLIVVCSGVVLAEEEYDFREINWGMSIDEVIENEGEPADKGNSNLLYETQVAGRDAYLLYEFQNDKLYEGTYFITRNYPNTILKFGDYLVLQKEIEKLYGEYEDETVWYNDRHRANLDNYGRALRLSHVHFRSTWENQNTNIDLFLGRLSDRIHFILKYYDNNFEEDVEVGNNKTGL